MEPEKPSLFRNWISTFGFALAVASAFVIVFFFILTFITPRLNPYIGIMIYIILPGILILGLIGVPVGMFVEWRRRQRTGAITYRPWPSVDLNSPHQRRTAFLFLLGLFGFVVLSAVGMYETYHYTDSVQFCGKVCHTVMKPEYTAYQASPHARVPCVDCHIGPGAGWYVKSKFSGLYQVYAVATDSYPRPIPTPIENLRPAQETCETCHWPRAFFGSVQRTFLHYEYDRQNTAWPIEMLVKIGGGSPTPSRNAGIHWHMNIAAVVQYIPRDERRQDIPWIRAIDRTTGGVTVYQDKDKPLTQEEINKAEMRTMDCMDCHNRPSHNYHSPDDEIDLGIETGAIDRSLPEIKKTAVDAMAKDYPTDQAAMQGIADGIMNFYRVHYPEITEKKGRSIDQAILAVQRAYAGNVFPYMRVKWSAYPNDIGHFFFPGCMRCHDGRHVSKTGKPIPNGCKTCHIIIAQGPKMTQQKVISEEGLEFKHPVDIGDAWKGGVCYNCHTGVQP